jgi:hypothetical protein
MTGPPKMKRRRMISNMVMMTTKMSLDFLAFRICGEKGNAYTQTKPRTREAVRET